MALIQVPMYVVLLPSVKILTELALILQARYVQFLVIPTQLNVLKTMAVMALEVVMLMVTAILMF